MVKGIEKLLLIKFLWKTLTGEKMYKINLLLLIIFSNLKINTSSYITDMVITMIDKANLCSKLNGITKHIGKAYYTGQTLSDYLVNVTAQGQLIWLTKCQKTVISTLLKGCFFFSSKHYNCSFARLIAPVVTTTSIILSPSKIQNGDIVLLQTQVHLDNGHWNGKRDYSCGVHLKWNLCNWHNKLQEFNSSIMQLKYQTIITMSSKLHVAPCAENRYAELSLITLTLSNIYMYVQNLTSGQYYTAVAVIKFLLTG